ncbi:MAG: hypothetical protein JSS66_14575 [Armatimonadetes bacterium]|nr:hypothetical protein [Armatimonadota bacterium]
MQTAFFVLGERHITTLPSWDDHKRGPRECGWFTLGQAISWLHGQANYEDWFCAECDRQVSPLVT